MKITNEHFGKKMRRSIWLNTSYFIPLGFNQNKTLVIGESDSGLGYSWDVRHEDWDLFEEPKKKSIKRLAPALCCYNRKFYISDHVFSSEQEAKFWYNNALYRWPASESMFIEVEVEE